MKLKWLQYKIQSVKVMRKKMLMQNC